MHNQRKGGGVLGTCTTQNKRGWGVLGTCTTQNKKGGVLGTCTAQKGGGVLYTGTSGKSVYLWSCKEVDVFYIVEIGIDIHVHVQ